MKMFWSLTLIFILIGCTKGAKSPDGLIKMFAKDVATKKLDMDYFEKYTTGDMLAAIQDLGLEDFEKKTRMVNVTGVKVKILNKNCEGQKCIITYNVKYDTKNKKEGTFGSEVKKVAELEQDQEYWKLAKVTNLKTFHESNEAINPLTDEAPKPEVKEEVK